MSLKIAVIGTHYVGKTTLCERLKTYLEKKGKNTAVITEVVRNCPFPVNEIATLEAQNWILNEQKKRELELQDNHDFIITDRGLIDNFAYWKRVAEKINSPLTEISTKEKEVLEHSKSYDIIFFLQPFSSDPKGDGFRSVDPEWRKEMHERVGDVVKNLDNSIIILEGDENQVFKKAKKEIDEVLRG